MIKTYCNFGIYNEDTSQCLEAGDSVAELIYFKKETRTIVKDAHIVSINADQIIITTDDILSEAILIEDIESWS